MLMPKQVADVAEKCWLWHWALGTGVNSIGLGDFVNGIGVNVLEDGLFGAAPCNGQAHIVSARGENPHRLVAREIASSGNHFLPLQGNRTACQLDLCADASRVGRAAF